MLRDIALDSVCSIRAIENNIRFVPYVTLGVADINSNPGHREDSEIKFATLKTAVVSSVQALCSKIWCFQCQSKGIPGINVHVYMHTCVYEYIYVCIYTCVHCYINMCVCIMYSNMYKTNFCLCVDAVPYFIGKRGEKINQLRKEFQHISIEVGKLMLMNNMYMYIHK